MTAGWPSPEPHLQEDEAQCSFHDEAGRMQDRGGAEPQAADIRAPARHGAILTSPDPSLGLASTTRGGAEGVGPPLNPGKDGDGAGAHVRGAERGRGRKGKGGKGWMKGGGGGAGGGAIENLTTCGLWEDAEWCTRVSAP